jgi:6-phosphofructokinase 1
MAFGNLALDHVMAGRFGRLVSIHKGHYDSAPLESVGGEKKFVRVERYYNADRMRPIYDTFNNQPLFVMTSDV